MYGDEIRRALRQYEQARPKIQKFVSQYDNQLAEQFDQIRQDISAVIAPAMPGLTRISDMARKMVRDAYPPNWSADVDLDLVKMKQIVETEGIPLFYVPRADIVISLLDADSFEDRLLILRDRYSDIGADCLEASNFSVNDQVADRAELTCKAVEAFDAGHYEAAQALAVVVCDSYLKFHMSSRYQKMREDLALEESEEAALWPLLRFFMPMATAVPFLEHWNPSGSEPAPTTFNRHVTIHGASTDQLNEVNATLAVMLAVSMTRALDAALQRYGNITGI